MKNNIIKGILTVSVICLTISCAKLLRVDNYAGPNAAFEGNVIDSVTGQNINTETGGFQIQMEQISYSANPDPYYIPAKPDGTFEDTRIFSGTYRITPTQGAFWPVDTTDVKIKGVTAMNFTVVPYIEIKNFTHRLSGDTLIMDFQIDAPRKNGLPAIIDAWPFVNNTNFVGSGSFISQYTNANKGDPNKNTIDINSTWNDTIASTTYELRVPGLLSGRTFYARVGIRVNDSYKKFDYSDVIKVDITK